MIYTVEVRNMLEKLKGIFEKKKVADAEIITPPVEKPKKVLAWADKIRENKEKLDKLKQTESYKLRLEKEETKQCLSNQPHNLHKHFKDYGLNESKK